jgi:hypothetical protein
MLHHKPLVKQEQVKSKVSRGKEIIRIRAEINEMQSRFFEKINKIDKTLSKSD